LCKEFLGEQYFLIPCLREVFSQRFEGEMDQIATINIGRLSGCRNGIAFASENRTVESQITRNLKKAKICRDFGAQSYFNDIPSYKFSRRHSRKSVISIWHEEVVYVWTNLNVFPSRVTRTSVGSIAAMEDMTRLVEKSFPRD
jgi:hypothetical protein